MSAHWQTTQSRLRFMLSDFVLFEKQLSLKTLARQPDFEVADVPPLELPAEPLAAGEQGYLMRSVRLHERRPVLESKDGYLYYTPAQFDRYFIDLNQTFEEYSGKFSSKTRSTIRRKIKKFSAQCEGEFHWRRYSTPEEVEEFFAHARTVSSKSYQEKLLDAGLPDSPEFLAQMKHDAALDQVRGYLLFDGEKPLAYMYCPISNGSLLYHSLGYDPEYLRWSVGTILHWFAFEDLFGEGLFRYFDFTEGQSEHKRMYSTGSVLCGNVYIFPRTLANRVLLNSHHSVDKLSTYLGDLLQRWGLKARVRRFIRFGRSS